jgi:GAF domain-containing protein
VANAIANARLIEVTQARVHEMEVLAEISTAVSRMFALDHTLDAVIRVLSEELEFSYISINIIDREANELQTLRGFGLAASLQGLVRSLDAVRDDILMDIARKKEIEVIDGWDDRLDREIWQQGGHQELVRAYVPLLVREESVGILEVGYRRGERASITDDQIRLLRGIADRVAIAIENARLVEQTRAVLEETKARAAQESVIGEIALQLQQATDMESLMRITAEELNKQLDASRVYVQLGMVHSDLEARSNRIKRSGTSEVEER